MIGSAVPAGLDFSYCAYPALKGWAKLFRLAPRDWGDADNKNLARGMMDAMCKSSLPSPAGLEFLN